MVRSKSSQAGPEVKTASVKVHEDRRKQHSNIDRISRIAELLNEVATLMKSEPQVDSKSLEQLTRLQLRLKIPTKRVQFRTNAFPDTPPARWLVRENRKETPIDFIRRVYYPWLGKGLSRSHIRHLDKSLYLALYKFLAEGGEIPPDIDLPTKKQLSDRELKQAGYTQGKPSSEQREAVRLYHLARDRARKSKKLRED
jgi:hypothetical protein